MRNRERVAHELFQSPSEPLFLQAAGAREGAGDGPRFDLFRRRRSPVTVWNGAAVLGEGLVRAQRSEPRPLAQHGRAVQVRTGERWRRERLRAE